MTKMHSLAQRLGFDVEAIITPGLDHSVDLDGIRRGREFAVQVLAA